MEGSRYTGFWYTSICWAIELGSQLVTTIFGDNPPEAPASQPPGSSRNPHTRRCLQNHDRVGVEDYNGLLFFQPPRLLRSTLGVALMRYMQFGGLVQYVAEVTGVDRNSVVHLNEDGKVGCINDTIRDEHPVMFKELQTCINNMRDFFAEIDDRAVDEFDKVQSNRLDLLNAVDFGGKASLAHDNLHRILLDCSDILARCFAHEALNPEMYLEMIQEIGRLVSPELYKHGLKGYRECYYEIERLELGLGRELPAGKTIEDFLVD